MVSFKRKMSSAFDVTFFGELRSFIGWKVKQDVKNISLSQERYIENLLDKYGMNGCTGTLTPMEADVDLRPAQEDEFYLNPSQHKLYWKQVGELLYLDVCTKPDVSPCGLSSRPESTCSHISAFTSYSTSFEISTLYQKLEPEVQEKR